MRVIKFRAYIKATNKIEEVISINFDTKTIITKNIYCYEFKDVILMQYTELKDKSRKEIYEGDIVQSDIDRALVKWNDKYGYFQLVPIGDYYFDSDVIGQALEYIDVEVIGNVYDNPELLEEGE